MTSYLSEMDDKLEEASKHVECGDLQAAEACFIDALKWNDMFAHYCYGKFLFVHDREIEAAKYLDVTYDGDYPPAIVLALMRKLDDNGRKWLDVDEAMLKKIQIAADEGHLLAAKYIAEYKMKRSEIIKDAFKYGFQLSKLTWKIRRIMKDPNKDQTPVWY